MNKIKFKDLPTYVVKTEFGDYEVKVIGNKYYNNKTLAIMLVEAKTGECFADLTVNIDGVAGGNFAYVNTNNNDWAVKFIEENKLGINTGAVGFSGFCSYPLFAFDEDKIIQEENIDFGGVEKMIEVKSVVLLDFENELDTLTKLKNSGQLDGEEEDKSFNYMLDQLDTHYRGKDGTDFSLDLYDIRNIMNILLEHHQPLIDCYARVIEYLGGLI